MTAQEVVGAVIIAGAFIGVVWFVIAVVGWEDLVQKLVEMVLFFAFMAGLIALIAWLFSG